jgi:hypothetical protein
MPPVFNLHLDVMLVCMPPDWCEPVVVDPVSVIGGRWGKNGLVEPNGIVNVM